MLHITRSQRTHTQYTHTITHENNFIAVKFNELCIFYRSHIASTVCLIYTHAGNTITTITISTMTSITERKMDENNMRIQGWNTTHIKRNGTRITHFITRPQFFYSSLSLSLWVYGDSSFFLGLFNWRIRFLLHTKCDIVPERCQWKCVWYVK